jgi:16S rRNA (guanine527-N7)-methyltransferase
METDARPALDRLASSWRTRLAEGQTTALLRFSALLMEWNAHINLTGARTVAGLIAEHLPDAFAVASVLDGPAQVVDVGSGGGLPAIPLAILRPALDLTLVEPLAKKASFLRTAVRELALSGRVRVEATRAGALAPAAFDVAMSRATFPPATWIKVAARLVRAGGRVLVLTVPGMKQPLGARVAYFDGRRELIQLTREECST